MKNHSSDSFSPWVRIAELMRQEHITAKKLAQIAGVVPSAVAKWKTGGQIGADKLRKIADHFGESVDWLLGSDSSSPGPRSSRSEIESSAEKADEPTLVPRGPNADEMVYLNQQLATLKVEMEAIRKLLVSLLAEERSRGAEDSSAGVKGVAKEKAG
ncbi:MAG: helix-turn-helix domain-containing protein [Kiritimatiellia bacterium]